MQQPLPARRAPLHYSFDDRSLESIGRTNFALLSKLNSIATRPTPPELGGGGSARAPPRIRTASEIARAKAQREIDRGNELLLRKLQATKPAVTAGLRTAGSRGAGAPLPAEAWTSPSRAARRPEWQDPMSRLPPRPEPRGAGEWSARGGGGGGGSSGGGGRTTMFKPGAHVASEASREDYLYD